MLALVIGGMWKKNFPAVDSTVYGKADGVLLSQWRKKFISYDCLFKCQ